MIFSLRPGFRSQRSNVPTDFRTYVEWPAPRRRQYADDCTASTAPHHIAPHPMGCLRISWKIPGHLYRPFQPRLLSLHQPVLVDIERTNLCSPTSICATLLRGQIRTRASSSLWHHVLVRCYDVIFFQSLPMPQNVGFLHQIFRMDQPEWVVGWNGW